MSISNDDAEEIIKRMAALASDGRTPMLRLADAAAAVCDQCEHPCTGNPFADTPTPF